MTDFPIQAVFSRGEITPRLWGRVDIDYYKAALQICRNFFTMRQGGLRRRPGMQWIAGTKNSAQRSRLHPFVFSQSQTYILEFGHLYVRFYALGGQVQTAGLPYEIVSPYTEAELFDLQFVQSADVLYISHRGHPPSKLTRIAETNWTLVPIDFIDGPYLTVNLTAATMDPSAVGTVGATVTIVASSADAVNGGLGFQASDVGRPITLLHNTTWGWGRISVVNSNVNVSVVIERPFALDTAVALWKLGAWTSALGYPARVGFFQERLIWASSQSFPQTIWASRSADLENHSVSSPAQDDDALNLTILAGSVQELQWIQEGQDLLMGTTTAARTLGASNRGEALTATNLVQRPQASYGALDIQPVQVGNVTLFVTYYGDAIREFIYSFENDAYIAPELTLLNEHILRPGIAQLAYAPDPDSIVWMALNDGRLGALTYERDQKMVALTVHEIGGDFEDSGHAHVESVACIPGLLRSELWAIVKRKFAGNTMRSVERLTQVFEDMDMDQAIFLDAAAIYDGPAVNAVNALHLAGQTVTAFVDGKEISNLTVSAGGVLALPSGRTGTHWVVGLPYRSRGRTLRIPAAREGSVIGKKVKPKKIIFDLLESSDLKVSSGGFTGEVTHFRKADSPVGTPLAPFTGTVDVPIDSSWDSGGVVEFECSHARPVTILSITPGFESEP